MQATCVRETVFCGTLGKLWGKECRKAENLTYNTKSQLTYCAYE